MVISLTATGLTTGEVQAHLAEVYGTEASRETVSKITDAILGEMADWMSRPLERVYPVVFIDALFVKVRDGQVTNRPPSTRPSVSPWMAAGRSSGCGPAPVVRAPSSGSRC